MNVRVNGLKRLAQSHFFWCISGFVGLIFILLGGELV